MQRNILEIVIEKVKRYLEEISKRFNIAEAYLFGSYVKGTWLRYSDIDLVIVSDDFAALSYLQRLEILYKIQWDMRITPFIEVIPLIQSEFVEKIERSFVLRDAKKYWIKIV